MSGLKNLPDLAVGKAVESQVSVLGDCVGVIDPVDALGHQDGLLLVSQSLCVIPHDVVQPGQHAEALSDFGMHSAIAAKK
jgi:hypothetical protein